MALEKRERMVMDPFVDNGLSTEESQVEEMKYAGWIVC